MIVVINRFIYVSEMASKDNNPVPLEGVVEIDKHKFILNAIIHHHGVSLRSGHYTTSIIDQNMLHYCDDEKVSSTPMSSVHDSSTAYVIFYKLVN